MGGEYRRNGIEEPFVGEGVVDPEKYENIVWVLKDTNDYSKPINELVANVVKTRRKTPMWRGAMWHNLGRVTGKLLNPSISFREAHRRRKEFLLNIAIFNLKKKFREKFHRPEGVVAFCGRVSTVYFGRIGIVGT